MSNLPEAFHSHCNLAKNTFCSVNGFLYTEVAALMVSNNLCQGQPDRFQCIKNLYIQTQG